MRGLWSNEKVDNGQWDLQKWWYKEIYNNYKNLEKEFVIHASHIISLSEKGITELENLYNKVLQISNQNIKQMCTIIPICADFEVFDYNKINKIQQLELKNKINIKAEQIVLCYSG